MIAPSPSLWEHRARWMDIDCVPYLLVYYAFFQGTLFKTYSVRIDPYTMEPFHRHIATHVGFNMK